MLKYVSAILTLHGMGLKKHYAMEIILVCLHKTIILYIVRGIKIRLLMSGNVLCYLGHWPAKRHVHTYIHTIHTTSTYIHSYSTIHTYIVYIYAQCTYIMYIQTVHT